jgi:hypothetical protein
MRPGRRNILSMLDETVRWTGMPARVADVMSDDPERKWRPLRVRPILSIATSCALFVLALIWPSVLDGMPSSFIIGFVVSVWGGNTAMMIGIYGNGPLGKSSRDEREVALGKDSLAFCLTLLTVLNVLGQPCLMILSHWQHWQFAQTASVVTTALMLNATLLACLPTLYASFKSANLVKE